MFKTLGDFLNAGYGVRYFPCKECNTSIGGTVGRMVRCRCCGFIQEVPEVGAK